MYSSQIPQRKNQGKPCFFRIIKGLLLGICFVFLFVPVLTFSNPQGGQVVSGEATITQPESGIIQINQTTDKAIINWQSYNVGAGERVHYQQPNASSINLNRINPNSGVSKIYGSVTSNGKIILTNPAGIWFGPNARVDVAGLIATTASISDADFLAGRFYFQSVPGWNGAVVNDGIIKISEAGLVALVGNGVVNNGLIEANLGTVVLGSGAAFTVHFSGNDMISFTIDQAQLEPAYDQEGKPLSSAITNTGKIIANGGKVLMKAKTVSDVLDHTINLGGVVEIKSVAMKNGELILDGGNGLVEVSGKILASGKEQNQTGGNVIVTGKVVALTGGARIDVSGDVGGGTVLIGGNAHGIGPLQNADYAFIGSNVEINADAIRQGNGGTVVLWSDIGTKFYGNIFARGGSISGNGGWVETSGKVFLDAMGMVTANAANGNAGSWLLDPANVTISAGATANGSYDGGSPNIYTTIANTAVANVGTINTSLDGGTSVTILTTPGGTQTGSITVSSAISKTGGGDATLTLTASGSIILNADVSSTVGKLNVVLTSGDDITIGGTVSSTVTTNGGDFTATAQNDYIMSNAAGTVVGTVTTGDGKVTINANQNGAGGEDFNMQSGSSIATTSTASDAVVISVNTAGGGSGSAFIRSISTGIGGGISIKTDTGGNITGTDITMAAGTLDVGTGTITITSPQIAGNNIGTVGLPIQIKAGTLHATSGTSGIFITNTGTGSLDLGTVSSTGVFTLTSSTSSGITDSGTITVTGVTTVVAGATQDITLNSAANNFSTITITSGEDVTINDTNAIIVGASTISGSFNLTTAGAMTQSAIFSVAGDATFTAGSGNNITFNTVGNDFSTVSIASGNNVLLRDANAIILGPSTISGTLGLTTTGAVTQSGPLVVSGVTTVASGAANDITLSDASNDFSTVAITTGNNVDLEDANALILGTSTVSGTFDVTTNGSLTQSGTITATGVSTLAAGALNNITLTTAANNFGTVNVMSGNDVSLRDVGAIILGTSSVGTSLTVTAAGAITQSGSGIIAPALVVKTLLNAGAAITLDNASNEVTTLDVRARNGADTANAAGAITFRDATGFDVVAATTTSTLTLTAGGAMTQSGAIAGTTFTAKTLNNLGSDITFNNASNAITTINLQARNAADTADAAGAITYQDANSIVISGVNTTSSFSLTAGTLITQTGALSVAGASTFTASLATTDFSLASNANDFGVTPVFSTTGAGTIRDILLRNVALTAAVPVLPSGLRNLTLTFDNNGMIFPGVTLTGALTATAAGAMTQSGPLVVAGITTLAPGASNDITLDDAGNNFSTVTLTNGNNVSLVDSNAIILGASTVSGALAVNSGAITQSGTLSVTGTTTLETGAASITLATATNDFSTVIITSANNVSLRDANALNMGASTVSGTLTLNSSGLGGGITQSGTLAVIGTTTLIAGTLNDITLNDLANTFSTVAVTSGNNVILADANALNIGTSTVTGNLTLTAGGALSDSGNIIVSGAAGLAATAVGGVVLNSTSNQFSNVTVSNSGSGAITLVSIVPMSIVGFSQSGGGTVSLTDTGTLTIADGVTIDSGNSTLTIVATDLDLSTTGALSSGTATTTITQNTAAGSIGLGDTLGTMSISGLELQRILAGNLTLVAASNGQIIVDGITSANSANISGTTTLTATAGTLGTIAFQTGASSFRTLTATSDSGTTVGVDLEATVGNLIFTVNAGDFTVSDGATVLSNNASVTITATDLNLNATGEIDAGIGNIAVTQNTVGGSVGLGATAGTMSISGSELERMTATNFTINAPTNGQIIVDGITATNSASISGTTTLTATAGTLGSIAFQTGASSFNALTANADNGITVGAAITTTSGNVSLNGDAGGGVGGNDSIALNANITSAGTVSLSAATGGIQLGSNVALTSAGTMDINDALDGGFDLTLDANDFNGDIAVQSLTINLVTGNMTGTISGLSGVPAILTITVLNTLLPNTIFFDGIDIYYVFNPPSPTPVTPTIPVLPQVVLPPTVLGENGLLDDSYLIDELMSDGVDLMSFANALPNECYVYNKYIELCGNWN